MTPSPHKPRLHFPAARRLKLSGEFQRVRHEGKTVRGSFMLLGVLASGDQPFRLGIVTSRRCGGAVVRNRIRRCLREIVRRHQHAIAPGHWIVLVARAGAACATSAALADEWLRLAKRASILRA